MLMVLPVAAQQARSPLAAAAAFRAEMASAVAKGAESPAAALERLAERPAASGLESLPRDADLAQAALDIAYQLLGRNQPEAAAVFFRAAEQNFQGAAQRSARMDEKARNLKMLGLVQAHYLNKLGPARANLAEAARLQPQDQSIAKLARQLDQRGEGLARTQGRK